MIAAVVITVLFMLVVTVALAGGLRRVVRDESEVERRLRAPDTHTVSFAVPNGVDAAHMRTALQRAGFASCVSNAGPSECLLVECSEHERERVRHVIESVHESAYDGSVLDLSPVVFEDEKAI